MRLLCVVIISLCLLSISVNVPLVAADRPASGISLRPSIETLTAAPGETSKSYTITLENDTAQAVTLIPSAVDFTAAGVNGGISLSRKPDSQHGLAAVTQFEPAAVSIPARGTSSVQVTLQGVDTLAPGGHFAFLRFSQRPQPGSSMVDLSPSLGSYVFLQTAGRSQYVLHLHASLPHLAFTELPSVVNLLANNTGNTQVSPHGTLTVTDGRQHRVGQATINTDSVLVLPGSTRLLEQPVQSVGLAWLPGRYTYTVRYRSQETQSDSVETQHVLYIGLPGMLAVLLVLVIAIVVTRRLLRRLRTRESAIETKRAETDHEV